MDREGAFALVEDVQGASAAAARETALAALPDAGPDVAFVLRTAVTVHDVTRGSDGAAAADRLLATATVPAEEAIALGLRALTAATAGDTAGLLADATRAVALLDGTSGAETCLAYVIAAAALNTLSLWELVDDLYALALRDADGAALARQREAVAVNRVLIGLEHGLALLEHGFPDEADARLSVMAAAAGEALPLHLHPVMRANVEAALDIALALSGETPRRPLDEHLAALDAEHDVQVRPLLAAVVALLAHRRGVAVPVGGGELTATSGARTFPLWVQAQQEGGPTPYAEAVAAQLWESRAAVLSAARAQLDAERSRAEHDRLALAVHTDPLTGLLNRRRFDDWVARGPAEVPTALLLLDLDGFKQVNDRFGHGVGDQVLRRVGLLLRASVRPGDVAIRQGGDEFAVVLTGAELDVLSVQARAEALVKAVGDEPWELVRPGLRVATSVGAAVGSGVAPEQLYRAADDALYRAKRERLGQLVVSPATPDGLVP